jgi:hypothetical protein
MDGGTTDRGVPYLVMKNVDGMGFSCGVAPGVRKGIAAR